jgi:WD40 repeat protein
LDTASGESVFEASAADAVAATLEGRTQQSAPNTGSAAVWSVTLRPDGKGFMSAGADKKVTFWDFLVRWI